MTKRRKRSSMFKNILRRNSLQVYLFPLGTFQLNLNNIILFGKLSLSLQAVSKHYATSSFNLQAALSFCKLKLSLIVCQIIQRVGTAIYIYIHNKSIICENVSQWKKAIENSRKMNPIRIFNASKSTNTDKKQTNEDV